LRELRRLDLCGTNVTEAGGAELMKWLPKVEKMSMPARSAEDFR